MNCLLPKRQVAIRLWREACAHLSLKQLRVRCAQNSCDKNLGRKCL